MSVTTGMYLVVAKAHFIIREELMMIERVPLIDRAQTFNIDRPVHDVFVHGPFEDVGKKESQRDCQPLEPSYIMDVLHIDVERRCAHRVDDGNMKIAVVPTDDTRAVLLSKIDLPLTDHDFLLGVLRRGIGLPGIRAW